MFPLVFCSFTCILTTSLSADFTRSRRRKPNCLRPRVRLCLNAVLSLKGSRPRMQSQPRANPAVTTRRDSLARIATLLFRRLSDSIPNFGIPRKGAQNWKIVKPNGSAKEERKMTGKKEPDHPMGRPAPPERECPRHPEIVYNGSPYTRKADAVSTRKQALHKAPGTG